MTDERKVELITKLKNWLQPANLTVYDKPDPNVEGSDGYVAFYDYIGVTFGKDAEEQAVLDEQLVKTIATKCGYPIAIVDKSKSGNNTGHFFTVWFKRLPQPEAPAPSANESAVSPPEPPTPAKEKSTMSPQPEPPPYEKMKRESYARHHCSMRNNFIVAAITGATTAVMVYALATQPIPKLAFAFSIIGVEILTLCAIHAIFEAGMEFAKQYSEPKLWEKESKYQKLSKEFREYKSDSKWLLDNHCYLVTLVKVRSPEIFAEFKEWAKKHSQSPMEEKKE